MLISPKRSSPWIIEFQKQLFRGKHVLLYGNVADLFLFEEKYISLTQFLKDYFKQEGYTIVGEYDIVDGLKLADQTMQPEFDRVVKTAMGGEETSPPQATGATSQPNNTSQRRPPRAVGGGHLSILQQPDQALNAIRIVLGQSKVAAAMFLDFSDKLVGDPERQMEGERPLLVQLKKIVQNAAYIDAGALKGRKNALVIIAGHLGALPRWVYQDNPFLTLLQVPRPRQEERLSFIRTFIDRFHEGSTLSTEQKEEVAKVFADLTDGLTAWDFEAIRRTSIAEGISILRPKLLIDYYKYGQRNDPWESLDSTKIRDARKQIESQVIGQPKAVEAVVNMLLSARVGISMSEVTAKAGKPKGTFFFVGPTGVGKTELAKALARLIFGDPTAFARFDMSEYAEQHAAEKLAGSPPGYVGYEEGGQLTNWVRERPFSILLFDEIEKANGRVMDKFLQILEDGRLTDGKGQTTYFSQTVIIFTSNIGSDTISLTEAAIGDQMLPYESVRDHYLKAVHNHFTLKLGRPELLNRLGDNIIVFDLLRPEHIAGISQKFINLLTLSAKEKRGVELSCREGHIIEMIKNKMLAGDNLLFGGRRIKTIIETTIERPLNRWIFFNNPSVGAHLVITPTADAQSILVNGSEV